MKRFILVLGLVATTALLAVIPGAFGGSQADGINNRTITIELIQKAVADHYGLRVTELKSKNNSRSVAVPRQVAMYLCKHMTKASLPEIGREFGGKHHTTVMHSVNKIADLYDRDADFHRLINISC